MSVSGYYTFSVKSKSSIEFLDITAEVRRRVGESGVKNGVVLVYTPHTTAGITINENADPAVIVDMASFMKSKFPHEPYFRHMEGNSPAHLMSSYISASEMLILDGGELVLGTWQGLYFCEFDGPRSRLVHVKIIAG